MRYVITGGTGHIGNNLIRYINKLAPNAEIIALVRSENPKELKGANCRCIVGDLNDETFLTKAIKKDDILIHLAGFIDLTNKQKDMSYQINFMITKKITEMAYKVGVQRFLYVGTVDAVYREGDGIITEPQSYYPDKIEGVYGKTKAMASQFILEFMKEKADFNCAIVLPTAVIGINDFKPSAVGKIIKNVLGGGAEFGIKGGYNFVDVEDVVKAIFTLCHVKNRGQYIISGENVSVKELYQKINEYKKYKKKPIIIPLWIARLASPFVKVLNKITIKALLEPNNYSSEKAKTELGYQATDFNATLKKTIDWFEGLAD